MSRTAGKRAQARRLAVLNAKREREAKQAAKAVAKKEKSHEKRLENPLP